MAAPPETRKSLAISQIKREVSKMSHSIGDTSLGIGVQAQAVLQYLSDMEPDFATYKDGDYDVRLTTRPWYNGREKGICISMLPLVQPDHMVPYFGIRCIHIAIFEHRNSDHIVGLTWETESPYWNGPQDDFNQALKLAYGEDGDKSTADGEFDYGDAGKCAQWVHTVLGNHYTKVKDLAVNALS